MELELDFLVRLLQQPGWDLAFSPSAIIIDTPSKGEAKKLKANTHLLASWAENFRRVATFVRYPGCRKPYRIPVCMTGDTPMTLVLNPNNKLIEIHALTIAPSIWREMGWLLEHPEQAGGIVRVTDNQQVVMSHTNAKKDADYTAGAGVKKAVTWKRSDFWHPSDLADFERDWRQGLEPNNPDSWLEFTWRSFDPELGISSPDGWLEFTNRYKLLIDEHGIAYHVSHNLGLQIISQPTA